jgi:hypothetical protein
MGIWFQTMPAPCHRLLVDADDAEAAGLEEGDDLAPAMRVVPELALGRGLHRDADVGLGNRPAVVGQDDARRLFGGIDAQDIARSAMQADMAEIRRLPLEGRVVEEEAEAVGGIGLDSASFCSTTSSWVTRRIWG